MTRNLNSTFMRSSTFLLAGYWGIGFALWYVLELALLILNPVQVRGVSESTTLVYLALSSSQSSISHATWFDVASWILDFKKIQAYLFLSFWVLTFSRLVSGPSAGVRWTPTRAQRDAVDRLVAYVRLPFWANCLVALALTAVFGGAATGVLGSNVTPIWKVFVWKISLWDALPFVAYRLSFLCLMGVVWLHMVIGFQALLGRVLAGQPRRAVARYASVVIRFTILVAAVEWTVWNATMGRYDWRLVSDILGVFILGLPVLMAFAVLFYQHSQDPAAPELVADLVDAFGQVPVVFANDPERIAALALILPRYTLLPLWSFAFPLFAYFVVAGIYLRSTGLSEKALAEGVCRIVKRLDVAREADPNVPLMTRSVVAEIDREFRDAR